MGKGRIILMVLLLFATILCVYLFLFSKKQGDRITELENELVFVTGTASYAIRLCNNITDKDLRKLGSGYKKDGNDMIFMDHYYDFGVRFIIKNNKLVGLKEYPSIDNSP